MSKRTFVADLLGYEMAGDSLIAILETRNGRVVRARQERDPHTGYVVPEMHENGAALRIMSDGGAYRVVTSR